MLTIYTKTQAGDWTFYGDYALEDAATMHENLVALLRRGIEAEVACDKVPGLYC